MSNLWHVTEICALSTLSRVLKCAWPTPSYSRYIGMILPIVPRCSKTH